MEIHKYEGKNLVELKEKALSELNASEEELYIRESEEAGGFLKGKKYKLEIVTKDDVVKYVKDFIVDVVNNPVCLWEEFRIKFKWRSNPVFSTAHNWWSI